MGRQPINRQIPPLSKIRPPKKHQGKQGKRYWLEEELRKAIKLARSAKRTPFYSMREVALNFKVSRMTVATVFDALAKEGVLTIVRGSQTFLEGKQMRSNHPIRGVVGIPIFLPSFLCGTSGRAIFIRLEEVLRKYDYITDFIFFGGEEEINGQLTERLLRHPMDILFWLTPSRHSIQTILQLQDAGVRVTSISDGKVTLPNQQYFLNLDHGFQQAAADWKNSGIREVVMVDTERRPSPANHIRSKVRLAFAREGFLLSLQSVSPETFFAAADRYSPDLGLIFLEHGHYERLCNHDWQKMEYLFRTHRTLLAQGPVYHPAFSKKTLLVDTIQLPVDLMVRTVSSDIAEKKISPLKKQEFFLAEWKSCTDLSNVTREG